VRFFAPDICFDDAEKYLPAFLKSRGKPHSDVSISLQYLQHIIEPVQSDLHGTFENEARERLRGRDESKTTAVLRKNLPRSSDALFRPVFVM
jgi:hypothetical protein